MQRSRDSSLFALTLMSAAAVLVSIAAAEMLLAITCVAWIVQRPAAVVWPSYFIPLCAFMLTTVLALLMSAQPEVGMSSVRKFVLFTMGLLAANMVTTTVRARISLGVLLAIGATTSVYALGQFAIAYIHFLSTRNLADDPTVLARMTGFMGHWMTFSGEQLLVWCAAIPAVLMLGRRWMIPLGVVGTALLLSFTRSAWLGAAAGFVVLGLLMPRKILISAALPVAVVAVGFSGLIYHRLSFSFKEKQFGPDTGRFELFIGGIRMIKDHPLFGVGPERIHTEFPHYRGADLAEPNFYYGHLENNIVQLAAERGLLCLTAFLWFIFELYASLLKMLKTASGDIRWIVLSALSALTGFMIAGLFSYNFGDSEVLLLLLFIVSLPYGVTRTLPVADPCPANLAAIPN
ncbi:MAG TPA: O-antigen ligase family protein [Terriglobia bacterium]|nr:O-antigen ligase family protein [Terriglobia bacterium]